MLKIKTRENITQELTFFGECQIQIIDSTGKKSIISFGDIYNPKNLVKLLDAQILSVTGLIPDFLISGKLNESYPERELYLSLINRLPSDYQKSLPVIVFEKGGSVFFPFLWEQDCVGKTIIKVV